MDQMIKIGQFDFKALVSKDCKVSINFQSKMTKKLTEMFTSDQLYSKSLYVYQYKPKRISD